MSRILFHLNSISERGTTTAALEYAEELAKLGNLISFAYDANDKSNNRLFMEKIALLYPMFPYVEFRESMKLYEQNFDFSYYLKSGENDKKLINGIPNYVHVVFQNYDPHGDKYAFVSRWLAEEMQRKYPLESANHFEWVPHIVNMPNPRANLRSHLGIPDTAICGIRIGGQDSFDINFVMKLVAKLVSKKDYYFIFVNTKKFIDSPNVIFLKTIFDKQLKSDLLATADYFLHARAMGESFGVSIVEAMQVGIPVFAWEGGVDKNHLRLLPKEMLYSSAHDLKAKIVNCRSFSTTANRIASDEFRPDIVMEKFLNVFPMG